MTKKLTIIFLCVFSILVLIASYYFMTKNHLESDGISQQMIKTPIKYILDNSKPITKKSNQDPETLILSCDEEDFKNIQEKLEKSPREEAIERLFLSLSKKEDDLLLYHLSSSSKEQDATIEFLKEYVGKHPENSLAQLSLILNCSYSVGKCNESFEYSAINNDQGNAVLWLNIASMRSQRNDIEGATIALTKAASMSNFNEYSAEIDRLYQDTLMNHIDITIYEKFSITWGIHFINTLGNTSSIYRLCTENSKIRPEISNLCIRIGKNMITYGQTVISKAFGYGLMEKSYRALGDIESADKTSTLREIDRKIYWGDLSWDAMELSLFDHELLNDIYETRRSQGELSSITFAVEEAIRLTKIPGYNPCPEINIFQTSK